MTRFKSALPALIVALALLARFIPGPRTIDDAFITFRYARNILAGQGFVYNPGEAVLGTTTPLYTLLMAGLGALTGGVEAPFPLLALLVNALADAVTCLLLWNLGRRLGFERAGVAAALAWAVAPFSVTFAIGGLETSLYVALLTGALAAVFASQTHIVAHNNVFEEISRRNAEKFPRLYFFRILAALLASLALLTRPDALILLVPLAGERLWSVWKKKEALHWGELAAALLPYGAWAVYAFLVFGSPLPHSLLAKAAAYRLEAGESLIRLLQHYATPFLEQNLLGSGAAVAIGLLLYPFLFLLALRRLARTRPRPPLALWVWALYPWLYLVTFAIPNPLIFRWYLTPPLPAYFFFIFIGLDVLFTSLGAFLSRRLRRGRAGQAGLGDDEPTPGPSSLPFGSANREGGESTSSGLLATSVANNPLKNAPPPRGTLVCAPDPALPPGVPHVSGARRGRRVGGLGGGRLKTGPSLNRPGGWVALLLLLPVVVSLADWRVNPDGLGPPAHPAPEMAFIQLERLYRQAAEHLTPRLTPQSVLAAGDVGVLGYYTPARILDTVGLNSAVSTAYYPLPADQYVINYTIPTALILDQHPDWIVILEVYGRRTFLPDPRFQAAYGLDLKIDTELYGSDGLLIFHKK